MPLTKKGRKIKSAMQEHYGAEKGEQVFYASQNAGKISGTHKTKKKRKSNPKRRDDGEKRMASMYGKLDL